MLLSFTSSLRSKRFCASSSRKVGTRAKKGMTGEGKGKEGTSSSPLLLPLPLFFFCSRSNFRAITRLETLATQAISQAEQMKTFSPSTILPIISPFQFN